jgi:hypothetical protein
MKTKMIFAALVAMTLIGCGKAEPETPIVPEMSDYKGTVTVMYKGEPFNNENIQVNFTPSEDGKTASIIIYQIRFVPQMPVTIDVTIPNVAVQSTTEKILLSCERTIPLAMGGEYPRYTVTDLKGEIVGKEMSFSLNFGDSPTSFQGQAQL